MPFKTGDLVHLKSGPIPIMTVIKVDEFIVCKFWNDGLSKFETDAFHPDALINLNNDDAAAPQMGSILKD